MCEVSSRGLADLLVCKVDSRGQARNDDGVWCFVDSRGEASSLIYFMDSRGGADLLICYVDSRGMSGWKDNHSMIGKL